MVKMPIETPDFPILLLVLTAQGQVCQESGERERRDDATADEGWERSLERSQLQIWGFP